MSLRAGEGDWSSVFSFFSVVIRLTDVGHEHMEDIIGLLFRYITLLQTSGTPKWIFDEVNYGFGFFFFWKYCHNDQN
jgi:insulysin